MRYDITLRTQVEVADDAAQPVRPLKLAELLKDAVTRTAVFQQIAFSEPLDVKVTRVKEEGQGGPETAVAETPEKAAPKAKTKTTPDAPAS